MDIYIKLINLRSRMYNPYQKKELISVLKWISMYLCHIGIVIWNLNQTST
jgi:hypothetical protein